MHKARDLVITLVAVTAVTTVSTTASAYQTYNGDNGNSTIYVGRVNPPGVDKADGQWICEDWTGITKWTNIGGTGGMTDNWDVHGDTTAGAGAADTLDVIRSTRTISGDCAAESGSWTALSQSTYWIYLHGDDGNDFVYSTAGLGIAWGHDGDDWVVQYASSGDARGGAHNDDVFGFAGSADVLKGEDGVDCLQDDNNSWTTYDCGGGSDYWTETNTASGKVSCETSTQCCFC